MSLIALRHGVFAVACSSLLLGLAACASRTEVPTPTAASTPGERTNATVRSVTYMEAAPNVAPAPPRAATAAQTKAASSASRRSAAAAKSKAAAKPAAAAPTSHGAASGWRYTYSVELDHGGTRNFGFPADQGLAVLDRVRVDGERLVVPPR